MQLNEKKQEFESQLLACERQIYSTCLHILCNEEDAKDCMQDAILKAYRAYWGFLHRSKFSTWLTRIAVHTCMDFLRRKKPTASLDALMDDGFEAEHPEPTPYEKMEAQARIQKLRAALQQLNEDMRLPIVLCDMQGMAQKEAAAMLHIPLGTLKSRQARARVMLLKILSIDRELFEGQSRLMDEGRNR